MNNDLRFGANSFTGHLATQLGQLVAMTTQFYLDSNPNLCSDVPTQLQALSSSVGGWDITSGTGLYTPCCEVLPDTFTCVPTPLPTSNPTPDCADGEYRYKLVMYDSAGDGWGDDISYTLSTSGTTRYTGSLADGYSGVDMFW